MKVGLLGGGNPHALAIARRFASLGIECFGIGRGPAKAAPLWLVPEGYRYYEAHLGSDLFAALDILDAERPDVIVNLAAQGEGAASFGADSWRFYDTNCVILAKLCEELRGTFWLQRFVHIGTSELYGSCETAATEESPIRASSPYSISKAAFDSHLQVLHRVHGFPMNIIRPSNCVTAGQQLHRIVPRAAISAVYGQRLYLQGGGSVRKSYLDTDDLADGILKVLDKGTVGEIYNCGPEYPIAIRSLVERVCTMADTQWDRVVDEVQGRIGEDSTYWLDSTKLRALGWSPSVPIDEALMRMVQWATRFPELAHMPHEYRVTP